MNRIKDPKLKATMAARKRERAEKNVRLLEVRYDGASYEKCPRCNDVSRLSWRPYCGSCETEVRRERYVSQSKGEHLCPDCGGESHRANTRCKPCQYENRRRLQRAATYRYESNPENKAKISARKKVLWAKRGGKLPYQAPCEVCGEMTTTTHHDDYEKPLAVRFLCDKHHAEAHDTRRKTDHF